MSIKAFDDALDFMPARKPERRTGGFLKAVSTFFSALADGRHAEAVYREQIARGAKPDEAVKYAFEMGYKGR